jgi:hypothetical protein
MTDESGESWAQLFPRTTHKPVTQKAHPALKALKEDHHRLFELPEHGMHAVVSIVENILPGADTYLCLMADCWEVDQDGNETGLRAVSGTHSIPHFSVGNDQIKVQDVVDHMTAMMVDRLAKRKKALSSLDGHAIKRAAIELHHERVTTPRGIDDDHHGI